jgi:hypothetical protein
MLPVRLAASNASIAISKSMNNSADVLRPNEVVFNGTKKYNELFSFWQLMSWFNGGTEIPVTAPDLFGCGLLPPPAACFGDCPSNGGYGNKQREELLELVSNEQLQNKPWSLSLKSCFNAATIDVNGYCSPIVASLDNLETNSQVDKPISDDCPIFGSPMLDVALGIAVALSPVQKELVGSASSSKQPRRRDSMRPRSPISTQIDTKSDQFDLILPPEIPTEWVQCEKCRKWRRCAWYIDPELLSDFWECHMNTWEPENANCDVPMDDFDPEIESTLESQTKNISGGEVTCIQVGDWRDVYCTANQVYYEAKAIAKKEVGESPQIKFHFLGWNSKHDEWIDSSSDRIRLHNLYTNPLTKKPSCQEKWQGINRTNHKVTAETKKRASKGGH